jgi:hypothetical protein
MLKLSSTLTDITYNAANKLHKFGCKEGADILIKIAQEVPEEMPAEQMPEAPANMEQPTPEMQTTPGQGDVMPEDSVPVAAEESDEPPRPTDGIPRSEDVEPVKLEDITPLPGAREGEYEELAGDLTLDDAARKLDEVAGMLADRRIIRQLAEFDIMLDKLGIASMFPELAESQSKLIDAYSYALTRVTKMMGQLANAKTLVSAQTGIPGAGEEDQMPAEEPQAQEPEADELGALE